MHGPGVAAPIGRPAVKAQRTSYVWWVAAMAALGGLLFGDDWVVIGGARQFYEQYFHLTSAGLVGWANSCALLGCLRLFRALRLTIVNGKDCQNRGGGRS